MHHRRVPAAAHEAEATTCSAMLLELQSMWDEIGESDSDRDRIIYQLEQECLDVYRKKVESTRKTKADLHRALADAEAAASAITSALGGRDGAARLEKPRGTLREQTAAIQPTLEALKRERDERIGEFADVQKQISRISAEIAGDADDHSSASGSQVDDRDLSLKRFGDLKSQLLELQKEKNNRLQTVNSHVQLMRELCKVMSVDFHGTMVSIHPCFENPQNSQTWSISNDTLTRLAGKVHSLDQEKRLRLKKLQDLGSTLIELWNLMDISLDEQKNFDHVTSLVSASHDAVVAPGSLALEIIKRTEAEVEKLNILKLIKAKELVLRKQSELEEIYRAVHMDVDGDATREMLVNLVDSGRVDLSDLLTSMEDQISKAREEAQSRRDILDKVEKWKFACDEENWLDDYERDHNRYSAGRGAHKSLKRAEKARLLSTKLPSMVENMISKVKAWESEKGIQFHYEKRGLLEILDDYMVSRQIREEEKRRCREQKKLQEQLSVEQEALYGSKPSPMRPIPTRKPLGQSCNANMAVGTPVSRRISTPMGRFGNIHHLNKEKKEKACPVTPVNYVALAKDEL